MLEIIANAGIAEVILLFILVFIIPMTGYLVLRLRRYENEYGRLAAPSRKKKKKKGKTAASRQSGAGKAVGSGRRLSLWAKDFFNAAGAGIASGYRRSGGGNIKVFVKVALWQVVEATDANPGFHDRLTEKSLDYLVCDAATGKPFTAICLEPQKGAPRGPSEELAKICKAADLHLVYVPIAETYDAKQLKSLLGIPDIEL